MKKNTEEKKIYFNAEHVKYGLIFFLVLVALAIFTLSSSTLIAYVSE